MTGVSTRAIDDQLVGASAVPERRVEVTRLTVANGTSMAHAVTARGILRLVPWLPDFDEMRHRGLAVLEDGLPLLTEDLKRSDMIPVSSWTTGRCGVVQFVFFLGHSEGVSLAADMTFEYGHGKDGWHPIEKPWSFAEKERNGSIDDPNFMRPFPYGVIGRSSRSVEDDPEPGSLAIWISGFHAPEVAEIWLVQDERTEKRPASGHFGAWTICTEVPTPLRVEAHDADGLLLGFIEEPRFRRGPGSGGALVPSRSPKPSGSPGAIAETAEAMPVRHVGR